MADDDTSTDETVESPKVDAEPASPAVPTATSGRPPVDRRSLGLGAVAVGALVLAFIAGLAVGGHHDRGGDRMERMRDGRGPFAPGRQGGEERGGGFLGGRRGMHGGKAEGGGMRGGMPGGGPGTKGGMGRGGHGGAGVVESASADELTIAPLGGRIEELTVNLDDDTEVKVRGGNGAGDIEDAEVSDIDEGDIVMVLGTPGDVDDDGGDDEDAASSATIDAKAVVILRDGDE